MPEQAPVPIRVIAQRTGIGPSTLRAWERRYGLLKPRRSAKGHRLYSEYDIELIKRVVGLLNHGHPISTAAQLVQESLPRALKTKVPSSTSKNNPQLESDLKTHRANPWDGYLSRTLAAVADFSTNELDAVYNQASALYPVELISKLLIMPALQALGEQWQTRADTVAEEHFFSAWLRTKLCARLHYASTLGAGPGLIVACAPGNQHETGALLFTLTAYARGYNVVYLGANMPLWPLRKVAYRTQAKGIILAGAEATSSALIDELVQLQQAVACPVFVGGEFSVTQHDALVAAQIKPIGDQLPVAIELVNACVPCP